MMPGRRSWFIGGMLGVAAGCMAYQSFLSRPLEQKVADGDPRELYAVVSSQITAFQAQDYPAAYEFAASGIRAKFPLEEFSRMVRETYPQLMKAGRLNFGTTQFVPGNRASVLIYLTNGPVSTPAIYIFVKERGKWLIEGVELIRGSGETQPGVNLQT